jgi:peptidyl-prolyl cis-trans isomerase C
MRLPLLIAPTLLAFAASTATAQGANPPRDLVEVNGTKINEIDFLIFASELQPQATPQSLNDPQFQAAVMNELVNTVLLSQDAAKNKLDKNPRVAAALQIARNKVLAQMAILSHVQKNPIKDEQLKKAYDEKVAKGPVREYKARNIVLKTEDDAKAVIKALDGGEKFGELAKSKSIASNAASGGELGWVAAEQMVKPIGEVVAKLSKGAYSKTPLQTGAGWMVLQLEDTRDTPPPAFDEVKTAIAQELQRESVARYVQELRKAGKLKVLDAGQPQAAAPKGQAAPSKAQAKPAAPPAAKKPNAEDMIAPKK